jgi:hypothetical protein
MLLLQGVSDFYCDITTCTRKAARLPIQRDRLANLITPPPLRERQSMPRSARKTQPPN